MRGWKAPSGNIEHTASSHQAKLMKAAPPERDAGVGWAVGALVFHPMGLLQLLRRGKHPLFALQSRQSTAPTLLLHFFPPSPPPLWSITLTSRSIQPHITSFSVAPHSLFHRLCKPTSGEMKSHAVAKSYLLTSFSEQTTGKGKIKDPNSGDWKTSVCIDEQSFTVLYILLLTSVTSITC